MNEQIRTWRIGELAEQAGLTVRTLRHYDRLGLLTPRSRTPGGQRCYTDEDVVRLQQIVALRGCGLSLEEIGSVLSAGAHPGLPDLLRRQLEMVTERIRQAMALRTRLLETLDALDRTVEPSITEVLRLIEETTAMNHSMTAEQLAHLQARRTEQLNELSADAFDRLRQKLQQTWVTLSRDEQALLVERRRALLPVDSGKEV